MDMLCIQRLTNHHHSEIEASSYGPSVGHEGQVVKSQAG